MVRRISRLCVMDTLMTADPACMRKNDLPPGRETVTSARARVRGKSCYTYVLDGRVVLGGQAVDGARNTAEHKAKAGT
jgi:hypothetical protein